MSEDPHNILIVRLSAIGDIIMSSSILPGLRQKYPKAKISWLTQGIGVELLEGNPYLDQIKTIPLGRWRKEWKAGSKWSVIREVNAYRKVLKAEAYDLVIDLQGLLKSSLWSWFSGAKRRVVLNPREGTHLLATEAVRDPHDARGLICRDYRLLAAHLKLDPAVFEMSIVPNEAELSAARQKLSGLSDRRHVLLFPFTTRPQKHWFDSEWVVLIGRLYRECGWQPWLLGGPGDLEHAKKIIAEAGVPVGLVAGVESNLKEKTALVKAADLCIGVDTGLTHLGYAQKTPTVALFGSTCPYDAVSPHPGVVLYDRFECSPCHRRPTCEGRFDCMRSLTVERVLQAARELL